jgi:hypothetical protein
MNPRISTLRAAAALCGLLVIGAVAAQTAGTAPRSAKAAPLSAAAPAASGADPVAAAIAASIEATRASADSQRTVDGLASANVSLLERYRTATWQAQQLNVYAQQLQTLLASQEAERASLEQQLVEIERTERELTPLMLRMLDSLSKFVTLDLPFLKAERRERIESLRRLMADPEANIAEKYRRILEAYRIEIDYGRGLGVERAQITLDGAEGREVDVLRVGRVALFYLSLDAARSGRWNNQSKQWEPLDERYRSSVRKGLKVAREISAPDVMILPMTVAQGGKP